MKNPFRRSPLTDANLRRMRELGLVPYTRVLLPLGRKRCIVLLTSDEREYMDTSDGLKVPLVTAQEFAQEYMLDSISAVSDPLPGLEFQGPPSVGCMRPVIDRRDNTCSPLKYAADEYQAQGAERDMTWDGLDRRYTCANCDRPRIEHVEGKRVDPKDDSRTYGVWCGKGLDTRWLVKSWDTCANCNRPKIEHTPTNSYCPGVGQSLGPNPGWNTWLAKSWD